MPSYHTPDQSFVTQVVQTAGFAITLARGIDQGKPFRFAGFQKPLFQRNRKFFWVSIADKTARGNRTPVPD